MRGRERGERGRVDDADLHVRVEVPEVQPTFPVHTGKDSWVGGAPLHVVHILTVVLKRAERHTCFALQGLPEEHTQTGSQLEQLSLQWSTRW